MVIKSLEAIITISDNLSDIWGLSDNLSDSLVLSDIISDISISIRTFYGFICKIQIKVVPLQRKLRNMHIPCALFG